MPRFALSDSDLKAARPREKDFTLLDGGGLDVLVNTNGRRTFRFRYSLHGKQVAISIGPYPSLSLSEARAKAEEMRAEIANGRDPRVKKRLVVAGLASTSFEGVAREWLAQHSERARESTIARMTRRFELYLFPLLGRLPIGMIRPPELLDALRTLEKKSRETAHRCLAESRQVFRYAVSTGRCVTNPSEHLTNVLKPLIVRHFAAITDEMGVGELMRSIRGYHGSRVVQIALLLSAHWGQRPGEIRKYRWEAYNVKKMEIAHRITKLDRKTVAAPALPDHIIPISRQAANLLDELRGLARGSPWLFPGIRMNGEAMSDATVNVALKALGYDSDRMVPHGFRTTFSTLANESGKFNPDIIEAQLSHKDKNQLRAIYNRAQYVKQRHELMQWWSDELARMENGAELIDFPTRAA